MPPPERKKSQPAPLPWPAPYQPLPRPPVAKAVSPPSAPHAASSAPSSSTSAAAFPAAAFPSAAAAAPPASSAAAAATSAQSSAWTGDHAGTQEDPIVLQGPRAERLKQRSALRAKARAAKVAIPRSVGPSFLLPRPEVPASSSTEAPVQPKPLPAVPKPPPWCNRVAAPWGEKPKECVCSAWPQYLVGALQDGWATRLDRAEAHDGIIELSSTEKPVCAYWRPGGTNMKERYFYNAVVAGAYEVAVFRDHTDAVVTKQVVLLN